MPYTSRATYPSADDLNTDPEGAASDAIFFSDVQATPVDTGLSMPKMTSPLISSLSQDDEDEVLFAGRRVQAVPQIPIVVDDSTYDCNSNTPLPQPMSYLAASPSGPTLDKRSQRSKPSTRAKEIIDDYIANISADEDEAVSYSSTFALQTDIGGFDGCYSEEDEWTSADLADFDNLSTSSEEVQAIAKVLGRRERATGTQYLVVGKGSTIDSARWLPSKVLGRFQEGYNQIQLFEEKQTILCNASTEGEADSETDEDAMVERDVQEAIHDAEQAHEFEERCKTRMSDEQMARLLAKQEELGMGSDELFLMEVDDNEKPLHLPGHRIARLSRKRRAGKNQEVIASSQPVDKLLGTKQSESYDELHRMDTHVSRKARVQRDLLQFQLSDSELEKRLKKSWANDRVKKKVRKQEREELRSQGLLGKKRKDKPDLRVKYASGFSKEQLKGEIKRFLASPQNEFALPPMDPHARKMVHEISHKLGLTSKSAGRDTSRYPVLYKTSRTLSFDESVFEGYRRFNMSRAPRGQRDGKGRKERIPVAKQPGRFGANNHYQDGEVVGASAPELGDENKGRAMLEKMGWSTGTGLGAINNKGIPLPVAQVVKTTRAGLG